MKHLFGDISLTTKLLLTSFLTLGGAVALTTTVATNEIIEDVIEAGGVRQLVFTRSDSLAAPRLFVRAPSLARRRGAAH